MFPFSKGEKKNYYNKPWLTAALKESIELKNKSFANKNKGENKSFANKNKGDNIQQKHVYHEIYRA